MKKERLEELRDKLIKCKGVCNYALENGEDGLILALIDAEIVRQSVTDDAVQRAIEWAERERKDNFRYMNFGDADSASLAIQALRQYQFPLAIQWTGKNLREVIDLVGLNPSANKWTWEEYEQIVKEKGLKIFTPDGPVMADVGDWIIQNCKDCFVTRQYQKPTGEAVKWAIDWLEAEKESAQNDWERSDADWRMEYGVKETHDERMSAFDLAVSALRQMKPSEWIPVSERLPEPINQTSGANIKNTYLVARYENCNPKGYFYGYQLARYWKSGWSGIDGSYGLSVTHWMPLPKPPEREINNERFLELCKQYGFAVQQDSQSPGIFLRQKDGTLREVTCFPPENEGSK